MVVRLCMNAAGLAQQYSNQGGGLMGAIKGVISWLWILLLDIKVL
ncbi:MAG: hypothetical protein RR673_09705 [Erysipelotrichaceae bacterium]